MTTAVDKWPAAARLMTVAAAGHLPTAVVTAVLLVRVGLLPATLTMEITTMTEEKIALRALLEKGSDAIALLAQVTAQKEDALARLHARDDRAAGGGDLDPVLACLPACNAGRDPQGSHLIRAAKRRMGAP